MTTEKSKWEKCTLNDLGVFSKGSGITKAEVKEKGLPCIRYGEIYTHHKTVISVYNSYIDTTTAQNSKRIEHGDILLAGSGETKEDIGKATAFMFKDEAYAGGDIVIFRPKASDSTFLAYLLNSQSIVKQKASAGKGDAVVHISATDLRKIEVTIPPITEQKAIAKALTDIDELIETLKIEREKIVNLLLSYSQLIFTKKVVSSSEFYLQKFGDVCSIVTGKKDVNEGSRQGKFPFFTCSINHTWSESFSFDTEAILIAGNGDVGNLHYYSGKFEAYQRTYVCTDFRLNSRYLWFYLNYALVENLGLNKVGSTIPYILKSQLADFEIPTPTNKKFIEDLVESFEAFNSEIECLEKQIEKYERIKQGMADDLLTGKVKL